MWRPLLKAIILLLICSTSYTFGQKIKVACVGNSITAGYLLPNPKQEAYPAQLQQLLGNKYEVGNFGFSGATLLKKGHRPYYKTKEFQKLIDFKADIAIIHLGLNDTDPRNWPNYKDEFQPDYQWLLDRIKVANPKVKIYICKLSPIFSGHPRFKSGTRDWYWQIQNTIEQIAAANQLPLIDLNAPLNSRPELFADNLHPDATGALIIAKTVCQSLTGNYNGFKLHPIFASEMVLQRDLPIPFYGKTNANELVEVKFNNVVKKAIANAEGNWKVEFPAMKFGGPYQIDVVSGSTSIRLSDVLIGDVWVCSGQSNMAFPVKASATGSSTVANLDTKLPIRLLKYNAVAETDNVSWDKATLDSLNELHYFSGNWTRLNAKSVADFSAVAYYFGQKIAQQEKIPVGLIQLAVGGSTLESWIDRKTIEHDNLLVDLLSNWRKSDFIQDWARGRADVNLKNASNPKQRHPYEPAYNYEAGIVNLIKSPIKGVIWYQGESNAHQVELFQHEMPLLVKSWRASWQQNFPFYYVQLSSIDRPSWPYFRDAQRKLALTIPHVGMAVSSDLGDSLNVHPVYKKEVGERLALLAQKNTYHRNVIADGPTPIKAIKKANTVVVSFGEAQKLQAAKGKIIQGFEIVDRKGNHIPVKAIALKNEIQLEVPANWGATKVLYAWQPFTRANLVNEALLPASTFSIQIN